MSRKMYELELKIKENKKKIKENSRITILCEQEDFLCNTLFPQEVLRKKNIKYYEKRAK